MDTQHWTVSEIAGSEVFDEEGHWLGVLVDVLPTGNNDVWVVHAKTDAGEKELMIPALNGVIRDVSVGQKRIVVALPVGLKEIYEDLAPQKKERK